jgi:ActR/RegA family two-component response regulator
MDNGESDKIAILTLTLLLPFFELTLRASTMLHAVYSTNLTAVFDRVTPFHVQTESPGLYRASVSVLKRVSGKLSRLLHRAAEPEPAEDKPAVHLLVVDDEESILFSMTEYFTQQGFEVDTASEVEEAEKLLRARKYEVIVQDLRLGTSERDGLQVVKLARDLSSETRIVVLTAYGSVEVEDETMQTGADAFLRKPKPLSQVAQVIQGLLDSPRTYATRTKTAGGGGRAV